MRKLQAYGQEFKSMDERCLILIWTDDSQTRQIFRAEIPNGRFPPGDEVLNNAIGEGIPQNHLFPPWSDTLTEAQQPLDESLDVFVKKPYGALLFYDGTPSAAGRCMKEIKALEIISKSPHANIVKYLGCIRNGNAVGGICVEKYVCTLMDLVQGKVSVDQTPPFQPDIIISGVTAGIDHLHSLGLVHNDINPMNIMVDKVGNAIITDFDSCVPVGAPCDAGTPGWSQLRTPNKVASFENDVYGLDLVSKFVRGEYDGTEYDFSDEEGS